MGGDTPVAVAAVVCGCLYRWVLSSVVVVVSGVGDGGGGLNFSRVHGFTYVSHYTGPRLSRRLGGYTSGHGPRTQILATFVYVLLFSHRPRFLTYPVCRRACSTLRLCPLIFTEIRGASDPYA